MLEADVLAGLTPDDDERSRVEAARTSLEDAATATLEALVPGAQAQVQGSVAKDTWIAGGADMDCFLLLPRSTPDDRLEDIVSAVATAVLEDPRKKYAQHPYVIGRRDGFQVDLVPAYRIESSNDRVSSVDRTPLHTTWVLDHLDAAARGDVRLAKQWCKGVGVYGAETRIGGFSGYLVEVLVHHHGGFQPFLQWAAEGCAPRRIAINDDDVDDDVSPLVVVDPVDPGRNCAAAVTDDALARITEAALAYQEAPDRCFFHPEPPRGEPHDLLHRHQRSHDEVWLGITLGPKTDRLDLVFPQFQRAARQAAEGLARAGFPVHRWRVDAWSDDSFVGMQWVLRDTTLPETRVHSGPRADKQPNADRFRAKWNEHPDLVGDVTAGDDGHLQVTLRVHERTPDAWLRQHHAEVLTGKHVVAAVSNDAFRVLSDPAAAPTPWAPSVADLVLDRRPWQRQ